MGVARCVRIRVGVASFFSTPPPQCLLPVFALGRAQELMLLLEELWTNHPHLRHIPIYFASQLAKKALAVFAT